MERSRQAATRAARRAITGAIGLVAGLLLASSPASAQTTPVEECHEGPASISADVGAHVPLVGCVFDVFHNPIPGVPVIWRLETTGLDLPGGDDPAHFLNFPEQVTDPNGQAHGVVAAHRRAAGHLTNVFFCTDVNLDGICDQPDVLTALLQISWTGPACLVGTQGPETIGGTRFADCMRGFAGDDQLRAGRGRDTVYGGSGDDHLWGGPGHDTLVGGPGFDVCVGGPGRDHFVSCELTRA